MVIEHDLGDGEMVTLSTRRRDQEIEERFNIVPGNLYGVTIAEINPEIRVSYVGRLERIRMHVCSRGFVLESVILRDGYIRDDSTRRTPFDREELLLGNERVTAFGVMDEEQFRVMRNRAAYENDRRREE